jgi:hypothetical protein
MPHRFPLVSRRRAAVAITAVALAVGCVGLLPRITAEAADANGATLTVDDPAPVDEGTNAAPGKITFTITRNGLLPPVSSTVHVKTVDGTAHAGADYVAVDKDVTVTGRSTPVEVTLVGDPTPEADETFTLKLSNNAAITDDSGTATIRNDDFTVAVSDANVTEGDSGTTTAQVPVVLSSARSTDTFVHYATTDGTAKHGSDYTTADGTLVIPAHAVSANITVPVVGDTLYEDDETFIVTIDAPSSGVGLDDSTGTVTIVDNEPAPGELPTVSVASKSFPEGDSGTTSAPFTVTLTGATAHSVTVHVSTADGTAKSSGTSSDPADYVAKVDRVITFAPSTEATQTQPFNVTINGDALAEPDETFTVALSQPSAATIATGGGTATGTILDDDGAPPVLSVADTQIAEGDSGTSPVQVTVTLTPASDRTVTVKFATADGSAKAPADYNVATGTVTFAPGETSKTIPIDVHGDTVTEGDETFNVSLNTPTNATLGTSVAHVKINDDDGVAVNQDFITTGAAAGGGSHVRVFDHAGSPQTPTGGFFPYRDGPGVRVARGDLDGDGHDEIIVAEGPGDTSIIQVFTSDGSGIVDQVDAYPGFTGGVFVAAGDVDGDGKDEVITAAGPGGGPHVRTFKLVGAGASRSLEGSAGFFAARSDFSGGLTVAAGDVNGDGTDEIIAGAAGNDQPIVYVWNYTPSTGVASARGNPFLAYGPDFRGGVSVAAGDLDGDDRAEIVTGAGPGGGPHVRVFSGSGGGLPGSAFAYGSTFSGGVWVAVGDVDGDGTNEIITAAGPGGGPHVRTFDVDMTPLATSFFAYAPGWAGGVYVAAGRR